MKIGRFKFLHKRIVGPDSDPLLIRYIIFSTPIGGVYLHKFCRSDYDLALHCHPWDFVSIILKGGYDEQTDVGILQHKPGSILLRPAEWRHRVIIRDLKKPSWNLILKGPRRRHWGFWPDGKFCWWRKFNYRLGICEEDIIWEEGDD